MNLTPNQKGAIAEAVIAAEAAKHGIEVLRPQAEHMRYDLAFDLGPKIVRVQCKWARKEGDVVTVKLATSRHTPINGYKRTTYAAREVDAVAVYCGDLDRCYFLPISQVEGRSAIHLRLAPAKNNQLAAINSASDHEFSGAVAQLARAIGWQPVGRGFESLQLHHQESLPIETVGAEEFGLHAPRYVQRAAAGEKFLITRRGRGMARLVPPHVAQR